MQDLLVLLDYDSIEISMYVAVVGQCSIKKSEPHRFDPTDL